MTASMIHVTKRVTPGSDKQPCFAGLCKAFFLCRMNHMLSFSPQMAVDYVDGQNNKGYVGALFQSNPVLREALDMLRSMAGRGAHHSPKLGRLTQIIRKHFATNDTATRAIVFTSYRDSVGLHKLNAVDP
jgi:hypothetical protein